MHKTSMIAISLATLIVSVIFGFIHFINTNDNKLRTEINDVRNKVTIIDNRTSNRAFSDWFERSESNPKKTKTGALIFEASGFSVECKLLE